MQTEILEKTKETEYIKIPKVTTASQMMMISGYGEDFNLPFRNLNFLSECEDISDCKDCLRLIKSYNEFQGVLVASTLEACFDLPKYWGKDNPNNRRDLLKFKVGREYSPVLYVEYFHNNKLATVFNEENQLEPFTIENLKTRAENFAKVTQADEIDIIVSNDKYIKYRFWWD